jgi:hypothetical protein
MRPIKAVSIVIVTVALLCFPASRRAVAAGTSLNFKGTFSGSGPNIPLDIDLDSCTTTGGVTVCTDLSALGSSAGKQSGGIEAGDFTSQDVTEIVPVAGTGCLLAPTQKSCTLGSVTNACEISTWAAAPQGASAARVTLTPRP